MKRLILCLMGTILAGCEPVPADTNQAASPLLRGCAETERLLNQMAASDSSFTYDNKGGTTIGDARWKTIPPTLQEGMMKAVAYHAICSTGEPRAQRVVVRSSQTREILADETFEDFGR